MIYQDDLTPALMQQEGCEKLGDALVATLARKELHGTHGESTIQLVINI
ncbi:hypothetical protein INT80_06210 [Gallibacterium anatis]|uniref:Uncharacterized protein n=1 Tax=Gallibacterium anatis TaxID=750 RepID=A0A930Y522_9PAST|nr:hypothetical protein [Gallibacterium anatis]